MFCKDCGTQLENGAHFCPNCGSAQAVPPPVQPVTPPVQPSTPPAEPATFADKVRATAKKVGSSPAFLAATICFTLTLLLNLLSLTSASGTFAYGDLFADQDLLAYIESLSLITGFINMLPSVLIAIGLLSTYSSCVSRKPKVNTAGLTMIFVVKLVQLVFTCLALLVALIPMIIVYDTEQWQFNGADAAFEKAFCLAIIITLAVVFAFVLLFYIKLCTTVTNVRSTLQTGVPNKRASRFVGIVCFISGAFLILNGIGELMNAGLQTLNGFYGESLSYTLFLAGISTLLNAATQILFGVLIFSYRSKMKALEEEERLNAFKTLSYAEPYTAPVYTPPQPEEEPAPEPELTTEEESNQE